MTKDIGNYASHARFWDWGGQDRTKEHDFWYEYACKYGCNILIPMCAWGESGAYMAQKGMNVTAFDLTPEMITEGKKRFGNIPRFWLLQGDVTDFHFNIPPVDFCYCTDFGHLLTLDDIKKALTCINAHLRGEGGLVIETGLRLPGAKSEYFPTQTWHPAKQMYPDLRVWKTGDTRYDASTGRTYISQTFSSQDARGNIESFDHTFCLQSYYHEEWLVAFKECGFDITGEYNSRQLDSWQSGGDGYRIFEMAKL